MSLTHDIQPNPTIFGLCNRLPEGFGPKIVSRPPK